MMLPLMKQMFFILGDFPKTQTKKPMLFQSYYDDLLQSFNSALPEIFSCNSHTLDIVIGSIRE